MHSFERGLMLVMTNAKHKIIEVIHLVIGNQVHLVNVQEFELDSVLDFSV